MNSNKLRAAMALHGDTGQRLSQAIGISHNTFSKKLNGQVSFVQNEIQAISERYSLSPDEIVDIFLDSKVS